MFTFKEQIPISIYDTQECEITLHLYEILNSEKMRDMYVEKYSWYYEISLEEAKEKIDSDFFCDENVNKFIMDYFSNSSDFFYEIYPEFEEEIDNQLKEQIPSNKW